MPSPLEIDDFWSWFATVAPRLEGIHDDDTVAELDLKVHELGPYVWELGPGVTAPSMLVISPDGDPDLLDATTEIIARAPPLPGWELHAAKPPRTASLTVTIDGHEIDGRFWRYVLYQYSDGKLEIVLAQGPLPGVPDSTRHVAAAVIIETLLGEVVRLTRICRIDPVISFTADQAPRSTSISHLAKHVRWLTS